MPAILETNPIAIRACILYEVRQKRPIFESFKNFCNAFGNDFMEYREFERWFYRFYHGNEDLDYDMSREPKTASLSELPIEILFKIVENLNFLDRLLLRNVSPCFRSIAEDHVNEVTNISVTSIPNHVHVCFYHESDYTDIICKRVDDDCVITKMSQYEDSKDWKIEGVSHVTVALNYLSRVLKSPKLKLEKLRLDFLEHNKEDTQCMEELLTVLENSEPHVLNIEFEGLNFHETSSVLKNLKNVEEIQLSMYSIQELSGIEKLVELEQWKTAKTLDISSHEDIEMDIKDLLHFQSIDVRLKSFSVQDAVKVKETLELRTSDFRSGTFRVLNTDTRKIGKVFNPKYTDAANNTFNFKTKNSSFEITMCSKEIYVKRKL